MNTSEFVELATLVLTIVSTLILPFLQRPILGYSNTYDELPGIDSTTSTELTVGLTNYGLAPASDVVISFYSENSNFRDFSIEPAIPGSNISYDVGHGIIEIENIAAGQRIEINGYMDNSMAEVVKNEINLSIFSNSSTAYSDSHIIIVQRSIALFAGLGAAAILYMLWQYYYRKQTVKEYDYAVKLID